ncbi:MAG: hypothetical protein NTV93_21155 [Verrucomicrobia bacterium]|nr:hypothetical protein [Verrucomicrobiota bacterium]
MKTFLNTTIRGTDPLHGLPIFSPTPTGAVPTRHLSAWKNSLSRKIESIWNEVSSAFFEPFCGYSQFSALTFQPQAAPTKNAEPRTKNKEPGTASPRTPNEELGTKNFFNAPPALPFHASAFTFQPSTFRFFFRPNQEPRTKNWFPPLQLSSLTPALPSVSPLRGNPPDCRRPAARVHLSGFRFQLSLLLPNVKEQDLTPSTRRGFIFQVSGFSFLFSSQMSKSKT